MDDPTIEITEEETGLRLDRFLRKTLPAAPLSLVYRLLRQGLVRIDGRRAAPGLRLEPGMRLHLELPPDRLRELRAPRTAPARSRPRDISILYRDEHVLALDKPAGMASQPGTEVDTDNLVAWLAGQDFPSSRTFRPAPVHRIDRWTSGVVLIGLSPEGQRGLSAAFREDRVQKTYLTWVHGVPSPPEGVIDAPLRRIEARRPDRPKVVVDPGGQEAHTEYSVESTRAGFARLRVKIRTGRMHQIRAHLAWLGHPVVGDRRYGRSASGAPARTSRLALHAAEVVLDHPVTGTRLHIEAPLPAGLEP